MYWIWYYSNSWCNLRIKDPHPFIDKETDNFPFRVFGVFLGGFALVCVGELLEFNELCCINDKKKKKPVLYIYFSPLIQPATQLLYYKYKLIKKPRIISIRYRDETLVIILFKYSFSLVSHKTIAFHILLATLLSRFLFCLATISIMLS